jgi:hypothetical protein
MSGEYDTLNRAIEIEIRLVDGSGRVLGTTPVYLWAPRIIGIPIEREGEYHHAQMFFNGKMIESNSRITVPEHDLRVGDFVEVKDLQWRFTPS